MGDRREFVTQVYPVCCTSAYCGRSKCDGCRNFPFLQEFKSWKERTAAICEDPIWCPLVYTAKHLELRQEVRNG